MCPNQIFLGQVFVSSNVVLVGSVGTRSRVFIVEDPSLITAGRGWKKCLRQLNHVLVNHRGRNLIVWERIPVGSERVIKLDSLVGQQGAEVAGVLGGRGN